MEESVYACMRKMFGNGLLDTLLLTKRWML